MHAMPPTRVTPVLRGAVLLWLLGTPGVTLACPFCTAQQPTLAQQLDAADIVALGELIERQDKQARFRIHKTHHGQLPGNAKTLTAPAPAEVKSGDLALLWATREAGQPEFRWDVQRVDETSYGYVMRAPRLKESGPKRLAYFARFLEHPDPLLATDAYHEFAIASFQDVEQVAGQITFERLRDWLADANVPDDRKGLYGLLLGINAARNRVASGEPEAKEVRLLRTLIEESKNDFRAGFDGILGGYLLATGEAGLAQLEQRFFENPKAAEGNIRHALRALAFYWEHGHDISADRQRQALRKLLARQSFARQTVIDLARWKDWEALPQVMALYDKPDFTSPELQRAIIGYLIISPTDAAAAELERLRKRDPDRVAETEKRLSVLGGLR